MRATSILLLVAAVAAASLEHDSEADPPPPPSALDPIPIRHPQVFGAPTARILPALVFYSGSGTDTGGNLTGLAMVGLGDVADFGVESSGHGRDWWSSTNSAHSLLSFFAAQLRMGIDEDRLFRHQPAVALGYRKSFEREVDGIDSRTAELYLAASKRLGSRISLHTGISLLDASMRQADSDQAVYIHDRGLGSQVRPILAIELEPKANARVMLETFWAPDLRYDTQEIALNATFAFGVRYALADWALLESGVSVPDVEGRDLLDAQIFARIRFITFSVARAYRRAE